MVLLRARPVQAFAVAVLLAAVLTLVLAPGGLPFDRPAVGTRASVPNIAGQLVQIA